MCMIFLKLYKLFGNVFMWLFECINWSIELKKGLCGFISVLFLNVFLYLMCSRSVFFSFIFYGDFIL